MRRYLPILFTLLALGGLAWSAFTITAPIGLRMPDGQSSVALDEKLKAIDGEIARVSRLEKTLATIDRLPGASPATSIVAVRRDDGKKSPEPIADDSTPPDISLVYVSPTIQKIAIDGNLYGPGQRLPDGRRVVAISSSRLVLAGDKGRQVLKFSGANALATSPLLPPSKPAEDRTDATPSRGSSSR